MRLGRLAFAGLMLFGGAAWAATGDALVVTGDGVNVRYGPGTDAGVKMRIYRNQQVIELERQGDWVRAEIAGTGGEEGWIHGSLLEPPGGAPAAAPAVAAAPEPAPAPAPAPETATAPSPEPQAPANEMAAVEPSVPEPAATPEPAVGPALDLPGLEQFRESVDYLNSRAQAVAGVELFTGVEARSEDVVQVTATDAWSTIPPAGQRSYLNTLVDRWAAAKGDGGAASVQIVDADGHVVMERTGP